MKFQSDYIIIGAGIIGLAIARELKRRFPASTITIIEKESDVAFHSSGRNSGVLHAGFYYTADSLKAKLTKDGNRLLREYCYENNLKINECQKVVVAKDESEIDLLTELENRGKINGVNVSLIDEKELAEIEPNAKTCKYALLSPTTATVDPIEVSGCLKGELQEVGIIFSFNEKYLRKTDDNTIKTTSGNRYRGEIIINAAGLYADRIAKDFGFSTDYTIIPFKGIYLRYTKSDNPIKANIYPVPDLNNPFLGVHFTVTVDDTIEIGPTAIPAFWRENYRGFSRFKVDELIQILGCESKLFLTNAFNFRHLMVEEVKKYYRKYFISRAARLVKQIDPAGFTEWGRPGIRAQLLNISSLELVQDFLVEGDESSVHILNAVSPAFTSSFSFAAWVVDNYITE